MDTSLKIWIYPEAMNTLITSRLFGSLNTTVCQACISGSPSALRNVLPSVIALRLCLDVRALQTAQHTSEDDGTTVLGLTAQ